MSKIPCPDQKLLLAYQTGELSEPTAAGLTAHISQCSLCQAELATLNDAADTLLSQLRVAAPKEPFADEPQCEAMIVRAMALAAGLPAGEAVPVAAGEPAPAAAGQPLPLGELGEYQLLEKLGEGGMGTVYKARQINLDRLVALKVLPRSRGEDERAVTRFYREMKAVGRVDHPNIVRAMDARVIDGKPVLVMEYVAGLNLAELLRRLGPLAIADACELVRQAAVGLQCVHLNGLVHRDIKPSNLMLAAGQAGSDESPLARFGRGAGGEGTQPHVKILDLGLARLNVDQPGDEMTASGQIMGTADFVAPEQATDSHNVDIRADIYSLGCTLYKLLAGHAPFSGPQYKTAFDKMFAHLQAPAPSIRALRPDVSEELAAVLDRMLAKDPAARFAAPAEAAEALAPFTAACNLRRLAAGAGQAAGPSQAAGEVAPSCIATAPLLSSPGTGTQPGGAQATKPVAAPQAAARGGRRPRWPRPAVASLLAAGAIFAACVIIIRIKDKAGHEQTIEVAGDSQITIEHKETPVEGSGKQAAGSKQQVAGRVARPESSMGVAVGPVRSTTTPFAKPQKGRATPPAHPVFPGEERLPGLVPHPAKLAGLPGRWQIETTAPREGVENVTWSPDDRLVACSTGNLIRIYDAATMKLVRLFFGHSAEIVDLAFSPDGRWLTSADGQDKTVRFWDLRGGRPGPMISLKSAVWRIAWRPDGTRLACRTADDLGLWNADGTLYRKWEAPGQDAWMSLRWSPDGKWLASAAPGHVWSKIREKQVHLWTAEGQPGPVLEHPGPVEKLAFSPDGRRLACAERTEKDTVAIRIWDTAAWKPQATGKLWAWIDTLQWAPDSRRLLISGAQPAPTGCAVVIWDPANDSQQVLYENTLYANAAWNRAGTWIACGVRHDDRQWAGMLVFWDVAHNRPGPSLGEPQTRLSLFAPSAKWLATVGESDLTWRDNKIRLWSADGRPGPLLCGHSGGIFALAWNPDGQLLASGSGDKTVRLWKPDGRLYAVLECGRKFQPQVDRLAWSPDGKKLVTGEQNGSLRLWDPAGWRLIKTIAHAQKGEIDQVAWSADGRRFASRGHGDAKVCLWSAEGSPGPVIDCHLNPVDGFEWSPDGRQLATCGRNDPIVQTWNAADGSPGRKWMTGAGGVTTPAGWITRAGGVTHLLWSPDGKWLAAQSSAQFASILLQRCDSGASREIVRPGQNYGDIECWSPDSKFLVFSQKSYAQVWADLDVWDVAANRLLRVLRGHTGILSQGGVCRWAADGRTLFSACKRDRTIRCWDVPTGEVKWVGLPLSGGQAATIAADGTLQTTGPAAEAQLVYVVEQPDGEQRLYTPAEFRKLTPDVRVARP